MNIIRDKERIDQTGEVFTPTVLVNEILDKLSANNFTDPLKTFCDPACGDGQFLVEVLKRKLKNGSTVEQAAKTIYGVDLMDDNIRLCQKRLSAILIEHEGCKELSDEITRTIKENIICSDAFEWDYKNWDKTPEVKFRIKNGAADQSLFDM